MPRLGSGTCVVGTCEVFDGPMEVQCSNCPAYVCTSHGWSIATQYRHSVRQCQECDLFYCSACDEMEVCNSCHIALCEDCASTNQTMTTCTRCQSSCCDPATNPDRQDCALPCRSPSCKATTCLECRLECVACQGQFCTKCASACEAAGCGKAACAKHAAKLGPKCGACGRVTCDSCLSANGGACSTPTCSSRSSAGARKAAAAPARASPATNGAAAAAKGSSAPKNTAVGTKRARADAPPTPDQQRPAASIVVASPAQPQAAMNLNGHGGPAQNGSAAVAAPARKAPAPALAPAPAAPAPLAPTGDAVAGAQPTPASTTLSVDAAAAPAPAQLRAAPAPSPPAVVGSGNAGRPVGSPSQGGSPGQPTRATSVDDADDAHFSTQDGSGAAAAEETMEEMAVEAADLDDDQDAEAAGGKKKPGKKAKKPKKDKAAAAPLPAAPAPVPAADLPLPAALQESLARPVPFSDLRRYIVDVTLRGVLTDIAEMKDMFRVRVDNDTIEDVYRETGGHPTTAVQQLAFISNIIIPDEEQQEILAEITTAVTSHTAATPAQAALFAPAARAPLAPLESHYTAHIPPPAAATTSAPPWDPHGTGAGGAKQRRGNNGGRAEEDDEEDLFEEYAEATVRAETNTLKSRLYELAHQEDVKGLEQLLDELKGKRGMGELRREARKCIQRLQAKKQAERQERAASRQQAAARGGAAVTTTPTRREGGVALPAPPSPVGPDGQPLAKAPGPYDKEFYMSIHQGLVGWLIGAGGKQIKNIMKESKAYVKVVPGLQSRSEPQFVHISGNPAAVRRAFDIVQQTLSTAPAMKQSGHPQVTPPNSLPALREPAAPGRGTAQTSTVLTGSQAPAFVNAGSGDYSRQEPQEAVASGGGGGGGGGGFASDGVVDTLSMISLLHGRAPPGAYAQPPAAAGAGGAASPPNSHSTHPAARGFREGVNVFPPPARAAGRPPAVPMSQSALAQEHHIDAHLPVPLHIPQQQQQQQPYQQQHQHPYQQQQQLLSQQRVSGGGNGTGRSSDGGDSESSGGGFATTPPPATQDCQELCDFLAGLKLEEYYESFVQDGWDMNSVVAAEMSDLARSVTIKRGHQVRLRKAIAERRERRREAQPVAQAPAAGPVATQQSGGGEEEGHDDDKLCVVCIEGPRTAMLLPCKHKTLCDSCPDLIIKSSTPFCPVCRARIVSVVRGIQD